MGKKQSPKNQEIFTTANGHGVTPMKKSTAQGAGTVSAASSPRPFSQDFSAGGKTQQHFTESVNVNNIVAHYLHTGVDPFEERKKNMTFGYASSKSFSEAMQTIAEVNTSFAELTGEQRQGFGNSPERWLDHLATLPPEGDEIVDPEPSEGSPESSDSDPPATIIEPESDST